MRTLLTTGNPKTAKGEGFGYLTAIQHLSPLRIATRENVCPWASKGCSAACLNTAGRGGIFRKGERTNVIQEARKERTRFYFDDPSAFFGQLWKETVSHVRRADRHGLAPALRLNGTSDIAWETVAPELFRAFPNVQFYDYTKGIGRALAFSRGELPGNYHLTFSRSESNHDEARVALANRVSVAAVFDTAKGWGLPDDFEGVEVIDGDAHDLRFLDPRGAWVGLRAKGRARKDTSGFVLDESN